MYTINIIQSSLDVDVSVDKTNVAPPVKNEAKTLFETIKNSRTVQQYN